MGIVENVGETTLLDGRPLALVTRVANYLNRPVDDFWYRNLFDLREAQEWACDFSNLHAFVPGPAWPQIAAGCEELRVLYTMRDPVKRLWSHTKFHLQMTGGQHHLDEWGPEDFEKFARLPHIWDNAEYGAVLRRMREGLTEEQRLAILFEDLHANQRGTLGAIEDFLGGSPTSTTRKRCRPPTKARANRCRISSPGFSQMTSRASGARLRRRAMCCRRGEGRAGSRLPRFTGNPGIR